MSIKEIGVYNCDILNLTNLVSFLFFFLNLFCIIWFFFLFNQNFVTFYCQLGKLMIFDIKCIIGSRIQNRQMFFDILTAFLFEEYNGDNTAIICLKLSLLNSEGSVNPR